MASFELPDWMADHMRRYLETDGRDGHMWRGVPTLLLTTTGRRTGEPRTLPLIYGEEGGAYLIIGSKGGSPTHPRWYQNLVAEPMVRVQVAADKFAARARTATGAEREIPVVVLEREG